MRVWLCNTGGHPNIFKKCEPRKQHRSENKNGKIKKYTTKTGKIRYEFQVYAGVDPLTGRQKTTRRRGFKTRKEASIVLSRLELEIEKRGLQEDERRFFRDVCTEWMEQYRLTVRESTLEKTQRIINIHVLPAFGDMLID